MNLEEPTNLIYVNRIFMSPSKITQCNRSHNHSEHRYSGVEIIFSNLWFPVYRLREPSMVCYLHFHVPIFLMIMKINLCSGITTGLGPESMV
jgi:hypothetical protein